MIVASIKAKTIGRKAMLSGGPILQIATSPTVVAGRPPIGTLATPGPAIGPPIATLGDDTFDARGAGVTEQRVAVDGVGTNGSLCRLEEKRL
jgi:hypothetical protein